MIERRQIEDRPPIAGELLLRILLSAIAVVICYQFRWEAVRLVTSELNVRLAALFGISKVRVATDILLWNGVAYQFVNACTFADVWCGAIPLLWDVHRTVLTNVRRVGALAVGLLVFNTFRLTMGDVLLNAGTPWILAHDILGGMAYLLVWIWLWKHAGWQHFHNEMTDWRPVAVLSSRGE